MSRGYTGLISPFPGDTQEQIPIYCQTVGFYFAAHVESLRKARVDIEQIHFSRYPTFFCSIHNPGASQA
jgi:hypothetical protein